MRTSALDVPSEGLKAGAQQSSASTGEPIPRLVQWLAGRGIGLVINAHKMVPDYVFTYGMLWNFVETGRFVIPPSTEATARPGAVHTTAAGQLLMGPPTEKYLPLYVRSVLREFLVAQGYAKPKILVLSSADFKQIDLAFSLESLNSPPAHQHKLLAEAISWFLPLHYNLVLASEKDLPEFFELK